MEQTERAFQKQPTVFLNRKKTLPKRKKGLRYVKSVGLGFKTPRDAIDGNYIDKKCPFTGNVSIRGRILTGTVMKLKMQRTIVIRRDYLHYIRKYKRFEKRHRNMSVHLSPCFRDVHIGDIVTVGECRPLAKTVRFNVLKTPVYRYFCTVFSGKMEKEEMVSRPYGKIVLSLDNVLLPPEKTASSPSYEDGLDEKSEFELRFVACELIQTAGILLKVPQVAMASGQVLFQRFYYSKSLVRLPMEHTAMAALCLASKIEEAPRRIRDIINVFHHIRQVRARK
ncbi:unnamed protein product [Notodromas monacha]|nr:unnamed protein product [Notodromas monacha]CAG0925030.1 unnamed protein product [Notodromas monacha]